jgi:hypothetical protein
VAVVRADLRDVDAVLADAGRTLNLAEPVALMFVAVLHCIEDCHDAVAIAGRYLPGFRAAGTTSRGCSTAWTSSTSPSG